MKIYLNVSFEQKETAKKMGARWDSEKRKWYSESPTSELLEKFGFGKKTLYNSDIMSRFEIQCKQHCLVFEFFKIDFKSKYKILETEDLKIPLFSSIQETVSYLIENGIIVERKENEEYKLSENEVKSYLTKMMLDNDIDRRALSQLGEEKKNEAKKAFESGLRSEIDRVMIDLNFMKSNFDLKFEY